MALLGMRRLYLMEILDGNRFPYGGWGPVLECIADNKDVTDEELGRVVRARRELVILLKETGIIGDDGSTRKEVQAGEQEYERLQKLLSQVGVGYSYSENRLGIEETESPPPNSRISYISVVKKGT